MTWKITQACQHWRRNNITNPRFTDDIDGLAGEEENLAKLIERRDKAKADGMEISAEKTKLMTTPVASTQIKLNEQ